MGRRRTFGLQNRWVATGEMLEEGGQAHIYVVVDSTGRRPGDHVAKLLKDVRRTPRLDNEIETTKRLYAAGCPVLEIVDDYLVSGSDAQRPWYVAPRITRGSLARHLREGEPYGGTFEAAMRLYSDVVTGVLAIHAQKVAHRDLKPGNILLDEQRVILADLGLALVLGEIEGERLTAELERIGSLHYTPPEAFSRRPADPQQFAFDAFALGKILYELVAGVPLPAFVSPTDPAYDLTRKWDGPAYRAVNRVLRGLLHDDPNVRLTYLGDLLGQIDELLSLYRVGEPAPEIAPRWHTDLLSASDLLAAKAAPPTARKPEDAMKEEADQVAREALEVWQTSEAVEQLESALGTARGGHLVVTRPTLGDMARSALGGLQPTRRGLEPIEDLGYPPWPAAEAGAHLSVASATPDAVPFRQLWLSVTIGVKDGVTAVATCVIRREEGARGTTDIVRDRVRVTVSRYGDPSLIAKVRRDAEEMLAVYVPDVIAEVKRVAKR